MSKHISNAMSLEEMKQIMDDTSFGPVKSLTNERTIGKMILDREKNVSHVWLLWEKEKGWVEYPIDFIPT